MSSMDDSLRWRVGAVSSPVVAKTAQLGESVPVAEHPVQRSYVLNLPVIEITTEQVGPSSETPIHY